MSVKSLNYDPEPISSFHAGAILSRYGLYIARLSLFFMLVSAFSFIVVCIHPARQLSVYRAEASGLWLCLSVIGLTFAAHFRSHRWNYAFIFIALTTYATPHLISSTVHTANHEIKVWDTPTHVNTGEHEDCHDVECSMLGSPDGLVHHIIEDESAAISMYCIEQQSRLNTVRPVAERALATLVLSPHTDFIRLDSKTLYSPRKHLLVLSEYHKRRLDCPSVVQSVDSSRRKHTRFLTKPRVIDIQTALRYQRYDAF